MISPPASLVPSEGLEPPITGSKPVVISISPRGLGIGGQAFHHGGKFLWGTSPQSMVKSPYVLSDYSIEAMLANNTLKIEKEQELR